MHRILDLLAKADKKKLEIEDRLERERRGCRGKWRQIGERGPRKNGENVQRPRRWFDFLCYMSFRQCPSNLRVVIP